MEGKTSKAKGDTKPYGGNLSGPIYTITPSRLGRGRDRGVVGEGQRAMGATWNGGLSSFGRQPKRFGRCVGRRP